MNEFLVWAIISCGTAIALNMLYGFAKGVVVGFKARRRWTRRKTR
jgi:hypothetical protein